MIDNTGSTIKDNALVQTTVPFIKLSGVNPLVAAAMPLLLLLIKFRETATHTDIAELRQRVITEINTFEANTQSFCAPQLIQAARYCLCTALDEVVLLTPWGSGSEWSQQSLLSIIHQETWGGERCFDVLEKMQENPAQNLPLLELMYLLLSLGFEGKYYSAEKSVREDVRQRLLHSISLRRATPAHTLSPSLPILQEKGQTKNKFIPYWKITAACAGVLLIVALLFNAATYNRARSTLRALNDIALSKPTFSVSSQLISEFHVAQKPYLQLQRGR